MPTTRRELLRHLACGAGIGALQGTWPRAARGQAAGLIARVRADLERHAAFGDKFSGGPGDVATANWIAGRLERSGYRLDRTSFDAPFFVPRTTLLTAGSTTTPVVAQAPVLTTPAAGVTAPLALVEDEPGEVAGRIALVVAPFARHAALFPDRGIGATVTAAVTKGARAVVLVTTVPSGEAIALNAPEKPFVPVPMAILAPKDAAPLVEAARAGTTATLVVAGDTTHRPCPNIVGRIERGDRWIAISTPRSGWYGCTAERGTGTAAFLEITDWVVERFPTLSVFVMNTGGHEYFFAGSHRVLDQGPPPERTLVWTHVGATLAARDAEERDGRLVMLGTADPQRTLMATETAQAAAAAAFGGLSGLARPVGVRPQAGELSSFTDRGYATAFAVIGVHRWFHTRLDTLDCVDAGLVVPVLRAHQRTIEALVARG